MEPTLTGALQKVFGRTTRSAVPVEDAETGATETAVTNARTWRSLAEEASALFEEAVSAQKDGKWSDYGEKLGALELTLKDLIESARKD